MTDFLQISCDIYNCTGCKHVLPNITKTFQNACNRQKIATSK